MSGAFSSAFSSAFDVGSGGGLLPIKLTKQRTDASGVFRKDFRTITTNKLMAWTDVYEPPATTFQAAWAKYCNNLLSGGLT